MNSKIHCAGLLKEEKKMEKEKAEGSVILVLDGERGEEETIPAHLLLCSSQREHGRMATYPLAFSFIATVQMPFASSVVSLGL